MAVVAVLLNNKLYVANVGELLARPGGERQVGLGASALSLHTCGCFGPRVSQGYHVFPPLATVCLVPTGRADGQTQAWCQLPSGLWVPLLLCSVSGQLFNSAAGTNRALLCKSTGDGLQVTQLNVDHTTENEDELFRLSQLGELGRS